MKSFHIEMMCDDEFGVRQSWLGTTNHLPDGISKIQGGKAFVNPDLFQYQTFFKPIQKILNQEKTFNDFTKQEFIDLVSEFGKIQEIEKNSSWPIILTFHPDNFYDLKYIYKDKNRIIFQYTNSPIHEFFLFESNNHVTITPTPFKKSYWTISETDWWYFTNYLEKHLSLSDIRDFKLNEILDITSTNDYQNLIRQMTFIVSEDRNKSNSFIDSVLSFHNKKGFITQKQADCVKKIIW